jgi:hypothetical protein
VLLDGDGRAQLSDFGIARLVDATRVTATGLVVGTAAYMAPEQVRGEVVGPPADVYALGLVLLEAVSGRREFEGGALEAAIARLHRDPVVPTSVPEPLASTIRGMTAPDPADRPVASEIAAALRRPAGRRRPLEGPLARRLVSAGAFASLAASAVAGMVLLSGADTARPAEPVVPVVAPEPVAAPPVGTSTTPAVADEAVVAPTTPPRAAPVPVALARATTVTRTVTRTKTVTEKAEKRTTDKDRPAKGGKDQDKDKDKGKDKDKKDDAKGDPAPGDGGDDNSGPGKGNGGKGNGGNGGNGNGGNGNGNGGNGNGGNGNGGNGNGNSGKGNAKNA